MIRNVNLLGHLPPFVQDFREIRAITNAEDPEFQLAVDDSERLKDNIFILHTDESGIKRFEDMFGFTSSKNDDLQNRQMNVLAHYTNSVTYTMRGLVERLDMLCGANNYTLKLFPDKYVMEIELYPRVENLLDTISSMLVDMIPANLLWTCIIKCNRHSMLAIYPHYLLEQFTHQEVYEETIEDAISATCDNIANYTAERLESIHCEHLLNFGMRKV